MKIVALLVSILLLTATAFAKEATFSGCTQDKKAVSVKIELLDEAVAKDTKLEPGIANAFKKVASDLSVEDLQSRSGYIYFINELTEDQRGAIDTFYGAPVVTGECK